MNFLKLTKDRRIRFPIKFFTAFLILAWFFTPLVPIINISNEGTGSKMSLGVEVNKAEAQFANGYSYRRTITIQESQVTGTSNLTNFPVLMSFTEPEFRTTANGGNVTDAQGDDIIFTSDAAGSTPLDYERERYTPTTGEITAWVEIPTLDFDDNTVVYMFYGNSSVTSSQENVSGTWDSNYVGVWHMDDSGSSNSDSAGTAQNGTVSGATAGAVGKIATAYDFDGTNDVSTVTDHNDLDLTTAGTIEAWIQTDDTSAATIPNPTWNRIATSTLGTAGTADYSEIDSVIVGELIYYGAALCSDGTARFYTATSTLDGLQFSVWTSRSVTGMATCGNNGGFSIGVDSDDSYIWYAVMAHNGNATDAVEQFSYATSTLSLTNFSAWIQPGAAPAGAGSAENSPIDITITGDHVYLGTTMANGTTENFFIARIKTDGSGWTGWIDPGDQPNGSGASEGCSLSVDTSGFALYYTSVCVNGTTEIAESAKIYPLQGQTVTTWAGAGDPDGGGATNWSNVDAALVGGMRYRVFYGNSGIAANMVYRLASSTAEGSVPTGGWINATSTQHYPNGTGASADTADPSIESDGKTLYYSAFAHDTTRTAFYTSSSSLPAHPFVSKLQAYELIQLANGYVFDWTGKPATFSTTTSAGTFEHVVVTHDGTWMTFFVNGQMMASSSVATSTLKSFATNGNNLLFGQGFRSNGSSIFFDGIIDEVRISNSARSADWILTGYNNQNSTSTFYTISAQEESTVLPTVTTNFATPGFNSATLHGVKTGGSDGTEHGFAYSTDSALVTGVSTTTLGALLGNHAFTSYITGLSSDQTYFYRAYVTNGAGTGVGTIKSFTTGNSTSQRNTRLFGNLLFLNGRAILNQQ